MRLMSISVEFLQQIVLPQQRAHARNLRLVEHEELPTWAGSIAATSNQSGAKMFGLWA